MNRLCPTVVLSACVLLAACAAPPAGQTRSAAAAEDPGAEAVQRYFAQEGLPAGWRLDTVSTHNNSVFVTVGLSQRLRAYERALPGRIKPAFFSAICPALRHPVWQAIGGQKDIVIEARDRPRAAFHVSCREHAPAGA